MSFISVFDVMGPNMIGPQVHIPQVRRVFPILPRK